MGLSESISVKSRFSGLGIVSAFFKNPPWEGFV